MLDGPRQHRAIALLALVPLMSVAAGCDAPTRPERSSPIESVTIDASLSTDGVVHISQDVAFEHAKGGPIVLEAPLLGSLGDLTVDGNERSGCCETTTVDVRAPRATIAYSMTGAVERYQDVAELSIVVWGRQRTGADTDTPVPV